MEVLNRSHLVLPDIEDSSSLLSHDVSSIENTEDFHNKLSHSMQVDHWTEVMDKLFADRLTREAGANRFERDLQAGLEYE